MLLNLISTDKLLQSLRKHLDTMVGIILKLQYNEMIPATFEWGESLWLILLLLRGTNINACLKGDDNGVSTISYILAT